MNNEKVLAVLADLIRPRLSPGNPIKHALYATVAEVKESQHTYAVLQTSQTQAKEIIPGNFTWRYPCRLFAMFYPPEDAAYTPVAINGWMEEAGLALVASCSALLEAEYPNFVPLDATVTGPIRWSPSASGGYEGSIAFTLTVQF
jgi:hypothetical protein